MLQCSADRQNKGTLAKVIYLFQVIKGIIKVAKELFKREKYRNHKKF